MSESFVLPVRPDADDGSPLRPLPSASSGAECGATGQHVRLPGRTNDPEPSEAGQTPGRGGRGTLRRRVLGLVSTWTVLGCVVAFDGSMAAVGASQLAAANASAEISSLATRTRATEELSIARAAVVRHAAAVGAATALLAASEQKVLNDAPRDALAATVKNEAGTDAASAAITALETDLGTPVTGRLPYLALNRADTTTSDLAAVVGATSLVLATHEAEIAVNSATLTAAVTAWEVEQARIAAAKAEAERLARVAAEEAAARAAAEQAAAARQGRAPASASSARSGTATTVGGGGVAATSVSYTVSVRTNVTSNGAADGAAVQAAIDAGGQVAVTYTGVSGITIVSAHNFNDATALALRTGDTVTFIGARNGTYRVINSMTVVAGQPVSNVLALGSSMLMQTCFFGTGTMRMVGLARA